MHKKLSHKYCSSQVPWRWYLQWKAVDWQVTNLLCRSMLTVRLICHLLAQSPCSQVVCQIYWDLSCCSPSRQVERLPRCWRRPTPSHQQWPRHRQRSPKYWDTNPSLDFCSPRCNHIAEKMLDMKQMRPKNGLFDSVLTWHPRCKGSVITVPKKQASRQQRKSWIRYEFATTCGKKKKKKKTDSVAKKWKHFTYSMTWLAWQNLTKPCGFYGGRYRPQTNWAGRPRSPAIAGSSCLLWQNSH